VTGELDSALLDVFPANVIQSQLLDEPSSGWRNYDRAGEMRPRLVGRTWRELDAQFVEDFHEALIFAGRETFGLMLPAYLDFLLKLTGFSHALYVVAGQLTRKDDPVDQRIFDARVSALTAPQRELVARIVRALAARPAMERALASAVVTWEKD
jgi:hypothetical protein